MGPVWKIASRVKEDLCLAVVQGRKPRYLAEKKITRRQTSFWLSFDGVQFDTKASEVRLLYRGKVMATVDVPPFMPGDTLTVNGSLEGRTEVSITTS